MKIPVGVECLIFDLGGVLVDLDWERCVNQFVEIGVDNIDDILSTTHQKGFLLDYELGTISTEEFREKVRELSSKSPSDSEIDDALTALLVGFPKEKLDLLYELKKRYKVLMLSNTNKKSFEFIVEEFISKDGKQIEDYFDKCYLSYEMGLSKPSEEIYQAILQDFNLTPEACMFFDDSPVNVEAAKKLGFHAEVIAPYSEIHFEI